MSFTQPYKLTDFDPGDTYFGNTLEGFKVSIYRSCMGGILEDSNFNVFLKRLGGESATIQIKRVGFSGDGWYEFIAIHESDTEALELASKMLEDLDGYPILDDDHFLNAENEYYTSIGYEQYAGGEWRPSNE